MKVENKQTVSALPRVLAAIAVLINTSFLGAFALPFYSVDGTTFGWVDTNSEKMTGLELVGHKKPVITTTLTEVEALERNDLLRPGSIDEYVSQSEGQAKGLISAASYVTGVPFAIGVVALALSCAAAYHAPKFSWVVFLPGAYAIEIIALLGLMALDLDVNPIGGSPLMSYHLGFQLAMGCALLALLGGCFLVWVSEGAWS